MNQVAKAIREHLFEVLSQTYECRIGSDHVDCSYLDYSEALEVRVRNELLLILFGSQQNPDGVRVMWSGGPMAYKDILAEAVVPDIAEPDFASFTNRIVAAIADFRLIAICDDS